MTELELALLAALERNLGTAEHYYHTHSDENSESIWRGIELARAAIRLARAKVKRLANEH